MKIEKWKWVVGYEGYYMVSDLGNVKSVDRYITNFKGTKIFIKGVPLKPKKKPNGYLTVNLSKDGDIKTFHIHRLVAIAFIPNPHNYPEVNHKNEVKSDNRVENLEWCTKKYNNIYGTKNERRIETGINNGTVIRPEERKDYYKNKAKERYFRIKDTEKYKEQSRKHQRDYRSRLSTEQKEENKRIQREHYHKKYIKKGVFHTPLQVFDTNMNLLYEFNSQTECSKKLNIPQGSISNVCCGKIQSYKGYIFRKQIL